MGTLEIREYDQGWPDAFRDAAGLLRMALGESTDRIDHIGSTSVPGLASKDVIDIQVSVEHGTDLDSVARALEEAGWVWWRGVSSDHAVPGLPPNERVWRKVLLCEPPGYRRVNVHVRVAGQPNQRYPLLFRDYLRAHPHRPAHDLLSPVYEQGALWADREGGRPTATTRSLAEARPN